MRETLNNCLQKCPIPLIISIRRFGSTTVMQNQVETPPQFNLNVKYVHLVTLHHNENVDNGHYFLDKRTKKTGVRVDETKIQL